MNELKKVFLDIGYTNEEFEIIINTYSIANMKPETLAIKVKDIYNFLLSLGYSKEEVIKMTKTLPSIYSLSIENMKQKIEDIVELGYSREEVIKMTKTSPSIYGYSIENMKQKIEDIVELGYSREEVIKMTKSLPSIYSLSIENMKQKIEFYDEIGLHSVAVIDPKQLMQSTKLSYARYMFYKEKGITITEENYRMLFVGQKKFEKSYGVTKEELIKKYPYNENNTIDPIVAANILVRQEGVLDEIPKADERERESINLVQLTNEGENKDDK